MAVNDKLCILTNDACYFLQNTIQHKFYCKVVLSGFLLSITFCPSCFKENIPSSLKKKFFLTLTCDILLSKNHRFKSWLLVLSLLLT